MSPAWELPRRARIGGVEYLIHADYRDILQIISYLDDPELPVYLRWQVALALFYEGEIPAAYWQEAMEFLADFLRCGQPEQPVQSPRLLDWQQDAQLIVADVNKAAGMEVRSVPFVHWWTFLSWFHAIGQGQLSTVVAIRDKLRRGQKLEKWEQDYYRENRQAIDLRKRSTPEERAERERLQELLGG